VTLLMITAVILCCFWIFPGLTACQPYGFSGDLLVTF